MRRKSVIDQAISPSYFLPLWAIALKSRASLEWDSFAWVELGGPPFGAWLEVQINQQMLTTSQPAIMRNKPGARHQACLDWLIAYQQNTLVPPADRVVPPQSKVPTLPESPQPKVTAALSKLLNFNEEQNCISLLLEVCQGMPWPQPTYQIIEEENGFRCQCSVRIADAEIVGAGIASNKKTAKHRAAREVVVNFKRSLRQDASLIATSHRRNRIVPMKSRANEIFPCQRVRLETPLLESIQLGKNSIQVSLVSR